MFMNLPEVNMMSVLAAAVAYFFIGWLWYSVLFMKQWAEEVGRHNAKKPSHEMMKKNMVLTFIMNLVTALAMAYLVVMTDSASMESGLHLGLIAALGLAATSIAGVFIWECRSLRLYLIDTGYAAAGIIASGIILSLWR